MSIMMAQMGLAGIGMATDYMAARDEAAMARKMQKYQNTVNQMNARRQTSAVNVNESRMRSAGAQAEDMIRRTSIVDQGRAAVAAASAGVKGNSVDMVNREMQGSADRASFAARRQLNQQLSDSAEMKKSIAIGAVVNEDIQIIPKPSMGAMLLGAGTNMLSIYQSHQPDQRPLA